MNKLFEGDSLTILKTLESESVHCCVTSPPYFGLRDYGMSGQIGLEETPEKYVAKLVEVFMEVHRVLRKDGTLWINLGDSYNGSGKAGNNPEYQKKHTSFGKIMEKQSYGIPVKIDGLKPKDLIGIPWMVAFALRSARWYLRQDIIWSKLSCMPESVTDRCTKSHEYVFLLSKSSKYYYDQEAIKTEAKESSLERLSQDVASQDGSSRVPGKTNGTMKAVGNFHGGIPREGIDVKGGNQGRRGYKHRGDGDATLTSHSGNYRSDGSIIGDGMANKRSVWTVSPQPFSEAHFATFPPDLIIDMIKAGCPEGGIVLDPFSGAGTTALVCAKLNRQFIGIELNPKYNEIARKRLHKELGFFNPLT